MSIGKIKIMHNKLGSENLKMPLTGKKMGPMSYSVIKKFKLRTLL